ncbi:MAG: non-heme iron oxygenase ferredoxin subunit [Gammaproteobacteria bacterium]
MTEQTFRPLLALAEVARGRMRSCRVGERELVVCHTRDGVFTVDNVCTHAFARMSEGFLKGTRLTCPLHGATFDVRNGAVLGGPATLPLAAYQTRVVGGMVEVELPVEASTK